MKYSGMPFGMWLLFKKSFRKNLNIFNIDKKESKIITKTAKLKYKEIIKKLPEFEKNDRFKMNIVSCAMFASFISNLKEKPTLEDVTKWYNESMMTKSMKWFCKKTGKKKFTNKDIDNMKKTAIKSFSFFLALITVLGGFFNTYRPGKETEFVSQYESGVSLS